MSVDYVHQIGTIALLVLTGVGASVVHSLLKKDHWSKSLNNGLAFAYAVGVALLDLWLKGQLHVTNMVPAFLLVYGASQGWYNALFVLTKAETSSSTTNLPVSNEL